MPKRNRLFRGTVMCAAMSLLLGGVVPTARAQWSVTNLHPDGASSSTARAVSGGQGVGWATVNGASRASLWSGSADSWLDLTPPGARSAAVLAVSDGQQVGWADLPNYAGVYFHHASLWTGSAESWVDLNDYSNSCGQGTEALDVFNGSQIGNAFDTCHSRAWRWSGSAPGGNLWSMWNSWVHLAGGGRAVVEGYDSAGFGPYYGVLGSGGWIRLGYPSETYLGLSSDQVVGQRAGVATVWNSQYWYVTLHPAGASGSAAYGVFAGRQVGWAAVDGVRRASLWSGTAESWNDLHAFLPPEFSRSVAYAVWSDENTVHVVGDGFNTLTGRDEALLWTRCVPWITEQPLSQSFCPGGSVNLVVETSASDPLAYQWHKDGGVVVDESNHISGATTSTLSIVNMTDSDAGSYACRVSNNCGPIDSDPATLTRGDSPAEWTQLHPQPRPSPRYGHAMAYDAARGVIVLFGGYPNNAETWEWDGIAWTQRMVGGPSARRYHAMAYDAARGVTVLFGGQNGSVYNAETWEWNGSAWSQRSDNGPSARSGHAMVYDSARGVTVLFGGYAGGANGETWEWDGSTWTRRVVNGPTPRWNHAMAYDSVRGVTVLFGGGNGTIADGETWQWNGSVWTQRMVAGPSPRRYHAMCYDASRDVTVLFGGFPNSADTWEWNGSAWSPRCYPGPTPRYGHAMAYDSARGMAPLFGGNSNGSANDETWELLGPCVAPSITIHPAAQSVCPEGVARFAVGASGTDVLEYQWRKDGVVLVDEPNRIFGATSATLRIQDTAESDEGSYDCQVTNVCGSVESGPAALSVRDQPCPIIWGNVRPPVPVPPWGAVSGMAYDSAREMTVLSRSGQTWEWNGAVWTLRIAAGAPTGTMAYDSARGVTVLWMWNGSTWEWDGIAWTQRLVSGPSPRSGHAMVYDSGRGVTVLFGGRNGFVYNAETWEWNGTTWSLRATTGPSPRSDHGLAYDSFRGVSVLFGGRYGGYDETYYNAETWEWNGTAWTQQIVSGPSPRSGHAMAYDSNRDVIVLHGGIWHNCYYSPYWCDIDNYSDTWEWNGSDWTQRADNAGPARSNHALAYDSGRGVSVLFGGITSSWDVWNNQAIVTDYDDTWERRICNAPSVDVQPAPQTVIRGGSTSFSVVVSGADPLAVYWRKNGISLRDEPNHISGATTATLVIVNAVDYDAGVYNCNVSNFCGAAGSEPALLIVCGCQGDLNCNGTVGLDDLADLLSSFGRTDDPTRREGDLNGDGTVSLADLVILLGDFGEECL